MSFLKPLLWVLQGCPLYFAGISATTAAAVAAGAAGVAGAAMSAGAAGDAANSQIAAQREANASNEKIANQQIDFLRQSRDQANSMQRPFANIGLNAQNRLAYMLGLGNTSYGFNDNYATGNAPKTYEWADWVKDNNAAIANLQKNKPKVGSAGYAKWQKDLKNRQLNLSQTSPNAKRLFESFKKNKDEEFKKMPSKEPMYTSRKVPVNKTYGSLMKDFTLADFRTDPGYNFRLQQGNQQLDRQLSAMGMRESGRALKEGMRFNQGLADQTYNDAFNRYNINRQNKYNFLSGVGGSGQQAATQISNNANQFGANASNVLGNQMQMSNQNIIGMGDSRARGIVGQSNAWQGGLNSLAGSFGTIIGNSGTSGGYSSGGRYKNLENAGFMA
jgi:hypothetical protein